MFIGKLLTSDSTTVLLILEFIAYISALLLAMSMHEFAHAFAAKREGDMTAKMMGRYTLAPFSHVDAFGMIFLVIFGFGWAKPVPVDSRNFKNGKKSALKVYSAGILANIIIGIIFALIYALLVTFVPSVFSSLGAYGLALEQFLQYMILLNFIFAFFNLLPFNGFDGYRLVETITKPYNKFLLFMQRYGYFILLLLIFTNIISIYLDYVALNLAELVLNGFIKLFSLLT